MRSLRIVIVVSVICLAATPFIIPKSHAKRSEGAKSKIPNISQATARAATMAPAPVGRSQQQAVLSGPQVNAGPVSPAVYSSLGLGPGQPSAQTKAPGIHPESAGLPSNMAAGEPFSAAVATTVADGFLEADLLGDWDGTEDDTADHGGKIIDSSSVTTTNFFFTRVAVSEHTIANGFAEDIFYTGDNLGNVYVSASTNLDQASPTPNTFIINLPTALNAFGTLNSSDQIVITGLAVSPVCDLSSFAKVNGAYASFNGLIGEILYVSYEDTGGGLRLFANGTLQRSGVLAFPIADITSAAPAPPGIVSPTGYPVQVGGAFGVTFSVFSNLAGVAVDDDGSLYFQQVDLTQFTGGNIVKVTSQDDATNQDRSLATSGFLTFTTLNPTQGQYGTSSGPAHQINRATNYSGTSTFFGNVISLAAGPGNVVYAAVARSLNTADSAGDQATEGLFQNPAALGPTPSMIITFADATGSFDNCSAPNPGSPPACPACDVSTRIGSTPAADGKADVIPGTTITWRAFVLGKGPDTRAASGTNALIFGTPANTLQLDMVIDFSVYSGLTVDEEASVFVISGGTPAGVGKNPSPDRGEILKFEDNRPGDRRADYIDFRGDLLPNPPASGGTVGDGDSDRFDHVFSVAPIDVGTVTPAGLAGLSRGFLRYTNRLAPKAISPGVGLGLTAGEVATVAVAAGGTGYTVGDTLTLTTGGTGATVQVTSVGGGGAVTGVALLTAGSGYSAGVSATTGGSGTGATITITVSQSQSIQGDDTTDGPILFEALDPTHQVSGGDDQVFPFRGDDDDGAGSPATPGPLSGGFEFLFSNPLGDVFSVGAACAPGNGVWNGFFLNSNGNITFGAGDVANISSVTAFRSGLPKIAGAWSDLNPGSRTGGFNGTFPVQAIGFANINAFKIRYINVPEFGGESCASANPLGSGQTNTFSITLYDDGTGIDENANQPLNPANPIGNNAVPFDLQEGPTALRWVNLPGIAVVGENPRPDGSGFFTLNYSHMDLLGSGTDPVITGFSIGNQNAANPPGLCELDLGAAAVSADTGFGGIQGETAVRWPTFIGTGTEPEIHEFFHNGLHGSVDSGTGVVTPSQTDFDLRFEGNGNATPVNQIPATDVNRDKVGFNGTTCQLPANPIISAVLPPNQFPTTPTTAANSLINAYAPVTVNLVGTGFFPNLATQICPLPNTGDLANPLDPSVAPRPGMTVTTTVTVNLDTNGDGVPDMSVPLTNITPVSRNLVTATLSPLANANGAGPGSPFPFIAPGGNSTTFTALTTLTAGNNNIFNLLMAGGFTRTSTKTFDTGARAPVVVGSSPSMGDSSVPQSLTISGFDFQYTAGTFIPPTNPISSLPRPFNVTAVFAVQRDNPANVIQATNFNVLTGNTISATFNFNNALAGTQFLIFAQNAAGTSRNALTAPGGASPNGNEQGSLVLFTVVDTTPPTITCPANITTSIASGSSTPVTYPAPVATDNQPGVTVSCDKASGSNFNIGTTTVTCTATDTSNNTASCSFTITVNAQNSVGLAAGNFTVNEGDGDATITLTRSGDTAGAASVGLFTSDTAGLQPCNVFNGKASQRCDYTTIVTNVQFAAGQTSATVNIPIIDDSYAEGTETFTVNLNNPLGLTIGAQSTATVTIIDNDVSTGPNPIDGTNFFVRQQYLDFLMRDPDTPGFNAWVALINGCAPGDTTCDRVHVSQAFFESNEFQQRGYFVFRFYPVSFPGVAGVDPAGMGHKPDYAQFYPDLARLSGFLTPAQLEAAKVQFAIDFTNRPAFMAIYNPLNNTQYVDTLLSTAGVTFTAPARQALIDGLNGGTLTRAQVLRQIVESPEVSTRYFNEAYVVMEYFGYLRRDPDALYLNWLAFLNANPTAQRTMVTGFVNSIEYRQRFGP